VADIALIVALGLAYASGRDRWRRAAGRCMVPRPTAALFYAGLAAVAVATAGPLDEAAARSLTAHMTQHVILLTVAAPLLAFGRPLPTLLWSLPMRARRRALTAARRATRSHTRHVASWIAGALVLQAVVMWAWHVPVAYEAAIRHPVLHVTEHATFLVAAGTAWWSVSAGGRRFRGAAAVAALLGSVPGAVLGAAMVLSPRPWYSSYVTGNVAGALTDQQIAGVVMWAFGGAAVVVAGALLFASWLAAEPQEPAPSTAAGSHRSAAAT
jgi:cytochrome c oxidase assembly factor CtaG